MSCSPLNSARAPGVRPEGARPQPQRLDDGENPVRRRPSRSLRPSRAQSPRARPSDRVPAGVVPASSARSPLSPHYPTSSRRVWKSRRRVHRACVFLSSCGSEVRRRCVSSADGRWEMSDRGAPDLGPYTSVRRAPPSPPAHSRHISCSIHTVASSTRHAFSLHCPQSSARHISSAYMHVPCSHSLSRRSRHRRARPENTRKKRRRRRSPAPPRATQPIHFPASAADYAMNPHA